MFIHNREDSNIVVTIAKNNNLFYSTLTEEFKEELIFGSYSSLKTEKSKFSKEPPISYANLFSSWATGIDVLKVKHYKNSIMEMLFKNEKILINVLSKTQKKPFFLKYEEINDLKLDEEEQEDIENAVTLYFGEKEAIYAKNLVVLKDGNDKFLILKKHNKVYKYTNLVNFKGE